MLTFAVYRPGVVLGVWRVSAANDGTNRSIGATLNGQVATTASPTCLSLLRLLLLNLLLLQLLLLQLLLLHLMLLQLLLLHLLLLQLLLLQLLLLQLLLHEQLLLLGSLLWVSRLSLTSSRLCLPRSCSLLRGSNLLLLLQLLLLLLLQQQLLLLEQCLLLGRSLLGRKLRRIICHPGDCCRVHRRNQPSCADGKLRLPGGVVGQAPGACAGMA